MSLSANQRLGSRTITAIGWSYGGAVLKILAQTGVQLLLARLLGPQAFGEATAAFFVLAIGWLLAEGGFGAALVQKAQISDHDVGYALGWVLLISCTTAAVIIAAAPWLAEWLGGPSLTPLIRVSGALIPVQALSNIPTSLMRRNLDMRSSQLIYLGGYIAAYVGIGLPLAWAGAGAWSLVASFGVHSAINLAGGYVVVRHTLRPRLSGDGGLRRFGLQVTGTNAANWAIDNIDRLIVNRYWGILALGEYTAAYTLSRSPAGLLVSSVQSVVLSSASRLQTDPDRLVKAFLAVLAFISLLAFPVFAFLAVHAELIVHAIYGQRWVHSAPLFRAFCAALPFYAILAVTGPILWAVDAVSSELKIQICTGIVVFVCFWGLSGFALTSVVWVVPAIYALRVLLLYAALSTRLKLKALSTARALAGGALIAALAVLVSVTFDQFTPDSLTSAGLGAVVTILAALLTLQIFNRYLVPPDLSELLRSRAPDSMPARTLCRLLALQPIVRV